MRSSLERKLLLPSRQAAEVGGSTVASNTGSPIAALAANACILLDPQAKVFPASKARAVKALVDQRNASRSEALVDTLRVGSISHGTEGVHGILHQCAKIGLCEPLSIA